ncbi:MAG: hypothetical protein QOJ91_2171 [Sphingomonadales bacterium]|jgi:hypothetical protein|nr:hypothetical protein [Sphingomonadales bacterium]
MPNVTKRISATFAAMAMATASLAAAPAPPRTGGGGNDLAVGQPCSPWSGGYNGLECCYFPGQGWYYYYDVVGGGFCGGYYQAPEDPSKGPSAEPTEAPGQ